MYRSNILGTRNLLDALSNSAHAPDAVLLASSANIYGNSRSGAIDESVPPAPANDYGVTKAATELLAKSYGKTLPIIVARPFNYTGRGQSDRFLIPKIVSHVRRREAEVELGNLDVARDFSDVRDVVSAYVKLLETPRSAGETFNICSGRAHSLRELLDLVQSISGHSLAVRVNPAFVRADEVRTLWGSPEKLQRTIGPLEPSSLEQTLRWMLAD
jgi:nucleoside-diphosphate-sugar epimerase